LGLALGTLFGLATAIVLSENFLPPRLERVFVNAVQVLAAIPSVVYGLWGLFVVVPAVRPVANWVHDVAGDFPLFSTRLSDPGMLPTAIVLGIMVLPTIVAISRDALAAVPHKLREAAYGIGTTHWEAILKVVVPTAARGIAGAIILAFGRAVGETMAVAMLIGNSEVFSWSLFSPGTTLAALLANHFAEADTIEVGALMYASLVLRGPAHRYARAHDRHHAGDCSGCGRDSPADLYGPFFRLLATRTVRRADRFVAGLDLQLLGCALSRTNQNSLDGFPRAGGICPDRQPRGAVRPRPLGSSQ
jgi:ABC-type molybdate transport system permease subunit